jgi:hypothetical protein
MTGSIRKPFRWQNSDWVCIGKSFRGGANSAEAYRVVHPEQFQGNSTTYREKNRDGDAARADPNGFYHGMTVTHAGQTMVLCGPPAIFIPGQTAQLDLFASKGQGGRNSVRLSKYGGSRSVASDAFCFLRASFTRMAECTEVSTAPDL